MKSPEFTLPNDEAVNAYVLINRRHPHIGARIEVFWGHKELPKLINQLLMDSRDGERAGFDWDILKAFAVLQRVHDNVYPQFAIPAKVDHQWRFG